MEVKRNNNVFGRRLKELREEAGLSMLQLAREIGVSDAAVCKWENGIAEPKVTYLVRLADYFDCTIDYLTGKDDGYISAPSKMTITKADGAPITLCPHTAKSPHVAAVTVSLSPEESKLLRSIQKLTPERRALLKETVNAWSNVSPENPNKKKT